MKLVSSVGAAQDAVSRFSRVRVDVPEQRASAGSSTVGSMSAAAVVANQVLDDLSDLAASLRERLEKVTGLASAIDERDTQDAGTWSWDV